MAEVIKAPNNYDLKNKYGVFLAGSIEMGKAKDWQKEVTEQLKDMKDIVILNPRRDDWDSSWKQTIENKQFREQVEWELKAQEEATVIAMNFCEETQSPITLLELGLFSNWHYKQNGGQKYMIVHCPEGFWRKGNVDIVCARYGIEQAESIEALISKTKNRILNAKQYDNIFKS